MPGDCIIFWNTCPVSWTLDILSVNWNFQNFQFYSKINTLLIYLLALIVPHPSPFPQNVERWDNVLDLDLLIERQGKRRHRKGNKPVSLFIFFWDIDFIRNTFLLFLFFQRIVYHMLVQYSNMSHCELVRSLRLSIL